MLALIHVAARHRIASIWLWLSAGLLLWAPQDTMIAWRAGIPSHLWINGAALLALIIPTLALYRIDRAHVRQPAHA